MLIPLKKRIAVGRSETMSEVQKNDTSIDSFMWSILFNIQEVGKALSIPPFVYDKYSIHCTVETQSCSFMNYIET